MPRFLLLCLALLAFRAGTVCGKDVLFAGYNVENYAPVAMAGGRAAKSAGAAAAVVQVIREINPDILGVCEMGGALQFEEFRQRLAAAGMGYVDAEWVDSPDPDRHLALVSRFPIVSRQSVSDLSYDGGGLRQKVLRGFLDVTVEIQPGFRLRIVGAHLKSKRPTREGSADLERRQEAHLLRRHLDGILAADPAMPLLVFGDFNDTKDQPALQEITGRRGADSALTELQLADSMGDRWTHHWKLCDVYSRIDFLFVNRALAARVIHAASGVHRSPIWSQASDHRPVYATLHLPAP